MSAENGNPPAAQGIGRILEEAREGSGLSFREVEERTRIRSRYLRDLEHERFDVLPAVYVLGSLKTYAEFLGLDGTALSRRLKESLVKPDDEETVAQPAAGQRRGEGRGAILAAGIGFDQLFLGMGVILISILAIMTLVAAIAREDEPPVSQMSKPSTPEAPSEMASVGNVQDRPTPQPRPTDDAPDVEKKTEPKQEKGSKEENEDEEASQTSSAPISSASASAEASSSASASAEPRRSSAAPRERDRPQDSERGSTSAAPRQSSAAPVSPGGDGGQPSQRPARTGGDLSAEVDQKIEEAFENSALGE